MVREAVVMGDRTEDKCPGTSVTSSVGIILWCEAMLLDGIATCATPSDTVDGEKA